MSIIIEGHPAAPGFQATILDAPDAAERWRQRWTPQGFARVAKGLEYLGPWCANCGRRGETCTGRRLASCAERRRKTTARILNRRERPAAWQEAEYRANVLAKWADMTFPATRGSSAPPRSTNGRRNHGASGNQQAA
jgi:hypothetical protein